MSRVLKSETRILLIICHDDLVCSAVIRGIHGLEHLHVCRVDEFENWIRGFRALGEIRFAFLKNCSEDIGNLICDLGLIVLDIYNLGSLSVVVKNHINYLLKMLRVAKSLSSTT